MLPSTVGLFHTSFVSSTLFKQMLGRMEVLMNICGNQCNSVGQTEDVCGIMQPEFQFFSAFCPPDSTS